MAKEKKSKEDKKKEKEEKKKKGKKGKKEEEEKEEKPKKEKKGKDKKDKKEKKEKPKKEKKKKKKKGEPEEPELQEDQEAPEEGKKKGKKKKDKKKSGKKGSKKKSKEEPEEEPKKKPKKAPAAKGTAKGEEAPEAPEGAEGAEGVEGAEGEQEPEPTYPRVNLSWAALHLLGMGFMLCDSLWIAVFPADDWLTCFGRLAYPIFAFLLVEGFFHTRDLCQYLLRLICLAAVSEIPFNLLYGRSIIYPSHQNVIWTYVIGLMFIILLDEFKERFGYFPMLLFSPVPLFLGYFLAEVLFTDYYGAGVLIILMFYLFRGRHWACFLGQLVSLWFINLKLLAGYYYVIPFLGYDFEFIQQAFAVLSLLLIWLYYGRQGFHAKIYRWFCYAFYPVYMLILFIIRVKLLV